MAFYTRLTGMNYVFISVNILNTIGQTASSGPTGESSNEIPFPD